MKNINVMKWFPTSIYLCEELLTQEENQELYEHILKTSEKIDRGGKNWHSMVYNTLTTFDLRQDQKFEKILNLVENNVNHFAKILGSNYNYKCRDSWFNIYKENDYQEKHTHADSHFSAIYFVKCEENSSPVVFFNPIEEMIELKNLESNELNYANCLYKSTERNLLIFRSHITHMVPKNYSKERISLAFNFSI